MGNIAHVMFSLHCTANSQAKNTATKKLGADIPKLEMVNIHLSMAELTLIADQTPSTMPKKEAKMVDTTANSMVAGTLPANKAFTNSPDI